MASADSVAAEQPPPVGSEAPSASVQQSAADQNVAGWFYLDAEGQHVGPFTTDQLAGVSASAVMHVQCIRCNMRGP